MPNLSNQPSTSSSNGKIPAELEIVPVADVPQRRAAPPETAKGVPGVQEVIAQRPRSLRMQYRFWRTVAYFGVLFVQTLFWYILVQRYFPNYVKRTNLERWKGWARSFRGFAIDMGGVMIKAGQFVSTRGDILPPEVTNELAVLRDEVPYVASYKIREIIEKELGPVPTRFSQFDDQPVAAASLGQVHRARLHNGDKVVVKVQRPGIAEICHTDLAAMNVVAHVAMRFKFISRRMDAVALIQEFGRVLLEELSYKHEARNAVNFARMFKHNLGVYIPTVYAEHSTDCVITIEDVTTIKLDDYEALEAAGISRKAVANRLMQTYLQQIFEERHFHADPHPGNLFVYPLPEDSDAARGQNAGGGRGFYLIFIDFGMTGTLTQQIVNGLVGTMAAVITRDSKKLIQSYSELGFLLPGADVERLEEATRAVFDQVWGLTMEQIRDVSFDDMADLGKEFSDLLFSMPFQVPQDFIYLGRTVSILSGLCTSLDPSFNPWSEMQPYMQKMITTRGSSDMSLFGSPILQSLFGGNGGSALLGIGQTLIGRALSPQNTGVLDRLERGEIKLRVEAGSGLYRQLSRIEGQGKRTSRAVVFGSFMVTSTLFYVNGHVALAVVGYVVSGVTFALMLVTGEQ